MTYDQKIAKFKLRISALEREVMEAERLYDELECDYFELLGRHKLVEHCKGTTEPDLRS